jgi:hypothetical protein
LVSAVPCDLYGIIAINTTAAVKYLKLYNMSAAPTVGTSVPFLTIPLTVSNVATHFAFPSGIYFNIGLSYALTGVDTDADSTALAAGDVKGLNLIYA